MNWFQKRRISNLAALAVAVTLTVIACRALDAALRPTPIYTGLLLLAILLLLTLFNARKKLPFMPVFKASTWMQVHIYVGLFSVALFLIHCGLRFPSGIFETVLALVFAIVSASGIFGLYLTRALPRKMTNFGEAVIYEQIPARRRQIQDAAEALVLKSESELHSSSITDFYLSHLRPFLQVRPSVWLALRGSTDPRMHELDDQMGSISRYLSAEERPLLEELRGLVEEKRNLDYQITSQRLLKLWLFIHIPFTYSLLILAFAHGALALTYGARF
jgi:hypothetical protein